MARPNNSNPAVLHSPTKASKRPPSPTKNTTRSGIREAFAEDEYPMLGGSLTHAKKPSIGIGSPPKSPTKTSQPTRRTKAVAEFKIFEDEEPVSKTNDHHSDQTTTSLPLRLAHVNSITAGLFRASKQKQVRSEDSEDEYDKENRLVEDEAEEASEDEDEEGEEEEEEEPGAEYDDYAEREELVSPPRARHGTTKTHTSIRKFMGYRETIEEPDTTETEQDSEDDGFDSLDGFIVSDNEDISYHESENDLPDDNDDDESETEQPSPKPQRRRLMRGRRPDPSTQTIIHCDGDFSHDSWCQQTSPPSPPSVNNTNTTILKPTPPLPHDLTDKKKMGSFQEDGNSLCRDSGSHPDSPTKKLQDLKLATPPSSPSKVALPSPSKTKIRIPPSPHRESSDAFWSQEITNDWNDQWSPKREKKPGRALQRLIRALGENVEEDGEDRLSAPSPTEEPKSPSKTALKKAEIARKKAVQVQKKAFDDKKARFAEEFLQHLDNEVSGSQIQNLAKKTGGIKIIWSKTLQTTAGRASWRKEKDQHHAKIELADRIIDCEDRLLNTLAHEYCHLANFMISNVRDNPHGAQFKEWGRKCTQALKDHPVYGGRVEVTTKHDYKINYKYAWLCENCGREYGRHSKSIDPTKSRCGRCKGILHQIRPKPRNVSPKKNNPVGKKVEHMTESVGSVRLSG